MEMVADSTGTNKQCLESGLVLSETEQTKGVNGSFNPPGWILS